MAEYVSPFAKSGSGGGSKRPGKERYISPFEGSVYNDDYWDKQDAQRQADDAARKAEEERRRQEEATRKAEEERKKRAERPFWEKGLEAVGKAFSPERLADVAGDAKRELVDAPVNTAVNAFKQAKIGQEAVDGPGINQKLVDSENKAIDDAVKSGSMSQQEADARKQRLKGKFETQSKNIAEAEKREGVKYDPNQGALDALGTIANIDLPVMFAKSGLKLGSNLLNKFTKKQADEAIAPSADVTKPVIDEVKPAAAEEVPVALAKPATLLDRVAGTKPAEYFFGDKQRVIDAQAKKGIELTPTAKSAVASQELPAVVPTTAKPDDLAIVAQPEPPKPVEQIRLQSRVFNRLKAESPDALKGDLNYDKINLQDQAEKASKLITEDKRKAYRVAMGAEDSADHTSTSVNIAMAEQALEEGNHTLYARLVKKRSLDQTRRGQELVSERGSISDNSTSRYVKELINTRMEKLGKLPVGFGGITGKETTKLKRAVQVIDKEVAKAEKAIKIKDLDIQSAQAIIDGLMCK